MGVQNLVQGGALWQFGPVALHMSDKWEVWNSAKRFADTQVENMS